MCTRRSYRIQLLEQVYVLVGCGGGSGGGGDVVRAIDGGGSGGGSGVVRATHGGGTTAVGPRHRHLRCR